MTTRARQPRAASRRPGLAAVVADQAHLADEHVRDRGVVEWVDPASLVIGPNVRVDRRQDAAFLESVRERGVLQPITCWRDDDTAQLVVWIGQRRALAATTVGRAEVPVWVVACPDAADRVVDQLVENDHRAQLGTAEHAAGLAQLALLGLPAGAIARKASLPRAEVLAALTVADSPMATAATLRVPDLTLDQAVAIADFEAEPAVVEQLLAAAERGGFEHALQQAQDDRRDAAERAAAAERLRAAGARVLDVGHVRAGTPWRWLTGLGLSEAEHRHCPGHAAHLVGTAAVVNGHRDMAWLPEWGCVDPVEHARAFPSQARAVQRGLDDAARDELEAAARARRAEVNRLEKAWASARTVRRAWLRDLARAGGPLPGAERWVLEVLLRRDHILSHALGSSGHRRFRDLMGLDREADGAETPTTIGAELGGVLDQVATASPRRALRMTAVLLLAAWEDRVSGRTWNAPDEVDRRYLAQMITWGYEPSHIERRLLTEPAP